MPVELYAKSLCTTKLSVDIMQGVEDIVWDDEDEELVHSHSLIDPASHVVI